MREILFRAKHYRTKQWLYGIPFKNPLRGSEDAYYPQIIPEVHGVHSTIDSCSIVEETIGQYTGLTDKNGNKIFEGDIVLITKNTVTDVVAKIFYSEGAFRTNAANTYDGEEPLSFWLANDCDFEVVGNIYDNPELLEK